MMSTPWYAVSTQYTHRQSYYTPHRHLHSTNTCTSLIRHQNWNREKRKKNIGATYTQIATIVFYNTHSREREQTKPAANWNGKATEKTAQNIIIRIKKSRQQQKKKSSERNTRKLKFKYGIKKKNIIVILIHLLAGRRRNLWSSKFWVLTPTDRSVYFFFCSFLLVKPKVW